MLQLKTLSCNFSSEESVQKKRKGKAKYIYYFFTCSAGSQQFVIQTHRIVMLHDAMPWSDRFWKMKMCLSGTITLRSVYLSVCLVPFQAKPEQQKSQHLWCLLLLFYESNINTSSRRPVPKMKYRSFVMVPLIFCVLSTFWGVLYDTWLPRHVSKPFL